MSNKAQLRHLICLLDDDHEDIQAALKTEFNKFDGDVSDHIASLGIDISPADQSKLSELLLPGRRTKLSEEWSVPENLNEDWDSFEHLLRILCDYMHDGISLRSSLNDAIKKITIQSRTQTYATP